ncbi:MAG: hypothetical protein WD076_11475 [Parvularculaceae bacterium]
MKIRLLAAAAALVSVSAAASPAAAWDLIGTREVRDRTERDTIVVEGAATYRQVKVCVYRQPIHFIDVDINFRNGGHQDVSIAARINPGKCTRNIDLEGGARDISSISFLYEETSFRRRTATVKVFAR